MLHSQQERLQEEAALRQRVALEREEGIRRIQGQGSEVNQIFKDLASIVSDQGQQFESLENNAHDASSSTREAVQELKKAVAREGVSRERLCCMLAVGILFLCFVVLRTFNVFSREA